MVSENDEVDDKHGHKANSHEGNILVNAKDENSQRSQEIFHAEKVNESVLNEEIHKGIYLIGSFARMEHRKVSIQHREQDDEEKRDEEFMAVAVNTQMGFPVRLPPN